LENPKNLNLEKVLDVAEVCKILFAFFKKGIQKPLKTNLKKILFLKNRKVFFACLFSKKAVFAIFASLILFSKKYFLKSIYNNR